MQLLSKQRPVFAETGLGICVRLSHRVLCTGVIAFRVMHLQRDWKKLFLMGGWKLKNQLVVLSLFFFGLAGGGLSANAEITIRKSGAVAWTVDANGAIRERGKKVGSIDSNGRVRKNGSLIGEVESGGTIRRSGSKIGSVDSRGKVRKQGRLIGEVDSGGTIRQSGRSWGTGSNCCDDQGRRKVVAVIVFFGGFFD